MMISGLVPMTTAKVAKMKLQQRITRKIWELMIYYFQ